MENGAAGSEPFSVGILALPKLGINTSTGCKQLRSGSASGERKGMSSSSTRLSWEPRAEPRRCDLGAVPARLRACRVRYQQTQCVMVWLGSFLRFCSCPWLWQRAGWPASGSHGPTAAPQQVWAREVIHGVARQHWLGMGRSQGFPSCKGVMLEVWLVLGAAPGVPGPGRGGCTSHTPPGCQK